MRPALIPSKQSLNAIHFDDSAYPFFYNPWHYHVELELTLVLEGHGQRLVGDSIANFEEGDLVLVGSNLSHVWKNDKSFYASDSIKKARAIVVKFAPDFLGENLWDIFEFRSIQQLIEEKAQYGLKLEGALQKNIARMMKAMSGLNDAGKLIQLLQILHSISLGNEYKQLASIGYTSNISYTNEKDRVKINTVLNYLMKNFHNEIKLDEVADFVCMNKNAFCRFFKMKTGKTMMQLLTEIRVGLACQKLQRSEDNVDVISGLVGFHNISNFNKSFKTIIGKTPSQYRKQWQHTTHTDI